MPCGVKIRGRRCGREPVVQLRDLGPSYGKLRMQYVCQLHANRGEPPRNLYVRRTDPGDVQRRATSAKKMVGPNGIKVEVVTYVDKMQIERRVFRLKRHGVWIGDYKTTDELGRHVDLAELVEDEERPATST